MIDELDIALDLAPPEGVEFAELWAKAYPELRQLARARLRRSGGHSILDTTGLVNEAFARLASAGRVPFEHRGQFFAYSARVMRSVVLNLARDASTAKRGADAVRVTLSDHLDDEVSAENDPLRIDEALTELAKVEPRLARVVEMKFFGGFTESEIATALDLTERTIRSDWQRARLLLRAMLAE